MAVIKFLPMQKLYAYKRLAKQTVPLRIHSFAQIIVYLFFSAVCAHSKYTTAAVYRQQPCGKAQAKPHEGKRPQAVNFSIHP